MNKLLGVVICGGKSQRMGRDKGLIPINSTCWASFIAQKLKQAGLFVSISVNASQTENYTAFFNDEQLIIDDMKMSGPLAGILSVHSKYPDKDLFLLACDMVDMQKQTIDRLIETYQQEPAYDFYVYQNTKFAEPFCAIYTCKGLNELLQQNDFNTLQNMSLQKVFNQGITRRLNVIEPLSFTNYNTLLVNK